MLNIAYVNTVVDVRYSNNAGQPSLYISIMSHIQNSHTPLHRFVVQFAVDLLYDKSTAQATFIDI